MINKLLIRSFSGGVRLGGVGWLAIILGMHSEITCVMNCWSMAQISPSRFLWCVFFNPTNSQIIRVTKRTLCLAFSCHGKSTVMPSGIFSPSEDGSMVYMKVLKLQNLVLFRWVSVHPTLAHHPNWCLDVFSWSFFRDGFLKSGWFFFAMGKFPGWETWGFWERLVGFLGSAQKIQAPGGTKKGLPGFVF